VTLRAAIAAALLSAAACAPTTRYEPPPPAALPSYKEIENWKSPQPRDADVRGAWWDVFADPALAGLEQRVEVSNQTLKIAEAQFAQARATVRGARANLYPQVVGVPAVTAGRPSANRATSAFHDTYADIVLPIDTSYEADVWGRLHGIVEANRTAAQATAADLETARLSLHAELAIDYFALRGLDREQQILSSAVDAARREPPDAGVTLNQDNHRDTETQRSDDERCAVGNAQRACSRRRSLHSISPRASAPRFFSCGSAAAAPARMPGVVTILTTTVNTMY